MPINRKPLKLRSPKLKLGKLTQEEKDLILHNWDLASKLIPKLMRYAMQSADGIKTPEPWKEIYEELRKCKGKKLEEIDFDYLKKPGSGPYRK